MRNQLVSLVSCVLALSGCSAGVEPASSVNGSVSAEEIGGDGAAPRSRPMIGFADLVRPDGSEPLLLPFALPDPRELGAPPAPGPATAPTAPTAKLEARMLTCRTLPTDGPMPPPPADRGARAGAEPPQPRPVDDGASGSGADDAGRRPPPGLEIVQVAVFDHGFDAKSAPPPRPDYVVECMAPPGEGPLALPQATLDEIAAAHGGRDAVALVAVARFAPPPPPPGADTADAAGPPSGDRLPPPPSGGAADADSDADSDARPPPPRGRGLYTVIATTALADGLAALVTSAPPS